MSSITTNQSQPSISSNAVQKRTTVTYINNSRRSLLQSVTGRDSESLNETLNRLMTEHLQVKSSRETLKDKQVKAFQLAEEKISTRRIPKQLSPIETQTPLLRGTPTTPSNSLDDFEF